MTRHQAARATAAVVVVALAVAGVIATWASATAEPRLRRELERWLSARFHSDVTVGTLSVHLFPLRVEGDGLTLRLRGRPDLPPFVTIRRWSGHGSVFALRVRRLDVLTIDGLELSVPPGRSADLRSMRGPPAPALTAAEAVLPPPVRIDELLASPMRIVVMPREPDRPARVWDLTDVRMAPFSLDAPAPFTAAVDTPLPGDRAMVIGTAGPWPADDFHELPIAGTFRFAGLMAAIPGLEGTLRASGAVTGTLDRLLVRGAASSSRVVLLASGGHGVPLDATFDAVLDGTTGDVELTRLLLRLASSHFTVSGRVTRTAANVRRHLSLAVESGETADVGDVARLLLGVEPPIEGPLRLDARLELPPGDTDLLDRVDLRGTMRVHPARVLDPATQALADGLSRRGQGRPDDAAIRHVPLTLAAKVELAGRRLTLRAVTVAAPGVAVAAFGTYSIDREAIAFHAVARLDAPLSRTLTGTRRWLLRPLDPLWKHGGPGSRVVLDFRGTRRHPVIDVDRGRTLSGGR